MREIDIDYHIKLQTLAKKRAHALRQVTAEQNLEELITLMQELKDLRELINYLCDIIPPKRLRRYVLKFKHYNRKKSEHDKHQG